MCCGGRPCRAASNSHPRAVQLPASRAHDDAYELRCSTGAVAGDGRAKVSHPAQAKGVQVTTLATGLVMQGMHSSRQVRRLPRWPKPARRPAGCSWESHGARRASPAALWYPLHPIHTDIRLS